METTNKTWIWAVTKDPFRGSGTTYFAVSKEELIEEFEEYKECCVINEIERRTAENQSRFEDEMSSHEFGLISKKPELEEVDEDYVRECWNRLLASAIEPEIWENGTELAFADDGKTVTVTNGGHSDDRKLKACGYRLKSTNLNANDASEDLIEVWVRS